MTLFMWGSMLSDESQMTPRFLAELLVPTVSLPIVTVTSDRVLRVRDEDSTMNSVLESFSLSLFIFIHTRMSVIIQASRRETESAMLVGRPHASYN